MEILKFLHGINVIFMILNSICNKYNWALQHSFYVEYIYIHILLMQKKLRFPTILYFYKLLFEGTKSILKNIYIIGTMGSEI